MSDWVRFHAELTQGAKRALSRSVRFVYMELSQRARKKRGEIVLTPGLSDVDGVADVIGGDRREISEALKKLSSVLPGDDEPMIRIDDRSGCRVLVVVRWEKWNPVDKTTKVRKARQRERESHGAGHGNVTRDIYRDGAGTGGVTEDVTQVSGHGAVTYPRAHALISPLSISDPFTADPGSLSPDAKPEVAPTVDVFGAVFLAAAWADGVAEVTASAPQPPTGGELRVFAEIVASAVDRAAEGDPAERWRGHGVAFARYAVARGIEINAWKLRDWMRKGRPTSAGPASSPAMKPPPEFRPPARTMSRSETARAAGEFLGKLAATGAPAAPKRLDGPEGDPVGDRSLAGQP